VNASLISGFNVPSGIAVSGSNLFVTNYYNGMIGEYTTSGATVNASLISGLDEPYDFAVVPEPSSIVLACLAAAGLAVTSIRRRRR
jgi:hypothetical protein